MDYTAITGAVDFSTALVAIGTVAAAIGIFKVGAKGASMVLSFLGR